MQKLLFLIVMFALQKTSAQSFLNLDIGNSILLRPNLGYEYRWKNKAIGGNIRWQRNVKMRPADSERRVLIPTSGVAIESFFKQYFYKFIINEHSLVLQTYKAPLLLGGEHHVTLYNSKTKVVFLEKIGLTTYPSKRLQVDFKIGFGGALSSKSLWISRDQIDILFSQGLEIKDIKTKFEKPEGMKFNWMPSAEIKMYCRI
jgi:hypothetical protein